MFNRMEFLQTRIVKVKQEITKFRARRSQSDPTFRQDLKLLQDELDMLQQKVQELKKVT